MQYSQEHLKTMVYVKFVGGLGGRGGGGANRVYYGEFENRECSCVALLVRVWRHPQTLMID